MKKYNLILLLVGAFVLAACGKEDDGAGKGGSDEGQASDWDGAGSAEVASSGEMQDSGLGYEYVVVDHNKDVEEFEVRRSIAGKESLIEHYEENDWDTAELEKELDQLKKQLKDITSD